MNIHTHLGVCLSILYILSHIDNKGNQSNKTQEKDICKINESSSNIYDMIWRFEKGTNSQLGYNTLSQIKSI